MGKRLKYYWMVKKFGLKLIKLVKVIKEKYVEIQMKIIKHYSKELI